MFVQNFISVCVISNQFNCLADVRCLQLHRASVYCPSPVFVTLLILAITCKSISLLSSIKHRFSVLLKLSIAGQASYETKTNMTMVITDYSLQMTTLTLSHVGYIFGHITLHYLH